ncbi:MAG: beta-ketoacyl-ACP synthase [Hallerella succinigenes]|uniref:beta-ketoacyl-ACP synthase n=1 Tax=Hallerella succinigenes TaxID=1896222 RepID=UPI0023F08F07|nr:beta-ketoacyl-ACP synthase [Hallerella succinigenes]MDD6092695.1 beta-ketoacyl-ACP synthase [Hallerella succinigenes]
MSAPLYIHDFALCSALGSDKKTIWQALKNGTRPAFVQKKFREKERYVVEIPQSSLPQVKDTYYDNHVNRLSEVVLSQMETSVCEAVKEFGADRIGVFIGSSDNGSEASLAGLDSFQKTGSYSKKYELKMQQADFAAEYIAKRFGLTGPIFTHSSACASSASAFASARNWLEAGFCDAAIVGGVDIATETVVLGFDSLEAVSLSPTIPFSKNRTGLTIGDGAAYFLVSKKPGQAKFKVVGIGESADADHVTAPRADGEGAVQAIDKALKDAELSAADIDYINLHGTGTKLNDAMESVAVNRVFGNDTPASSTKGLTGHTLGAAGALEAAFCCLTLSDENTEHVLPMHVFDGERDPSIPEIRLVKNGETAKRLNICMSNSFGFGGCNVSLILSRNV